MASIFDGYQNRATVFSFKDPITGDEKEFAVDATISIRTNLRASISKYPVEGEDNITDHVQPEPLTLSITGFISESPSQQLLSLATTIATAGILSTGQFQGLSSTFATAAIASLSSLAVSGGGDADKKASYVKLLTQRSEVDPNFPKRAMLGLTRAFEQGVNFNIRTFFSDVIYKNMVINQLSFEQDKDSGDSLNFTMTMQKVTTVQAFSRVATELKMADPAGSSAAAAEDKGKVTGDEKPPRTVAAQLIDGLVGG